MNVVYELDMHVQTGAGMTSVVPTVVLGIDVIGWLVEVFDVVGWLVEVLDVVG